MLSDEFHEWTKATSFRSHNLSSDVASLGSPLSIIRDRHWVEKWRFVRKKDQSQSEGKSQSTPKGWSEKVKSCLLRNGV